MPHGSALMRIVGFAMAGTFAVALPCAAAVVLTDAADVRLGNVVETETSVAVSPVDPRVIVISNIRHPFGVTAWISTDGGLTWTDHTSGGGFDKADPSAAISGIVPGGQITIAHNQDGPTRRVGSHEKIGTNPATPWTENPTAIEDEDKPHLTVDNSPHSSRQFDMFCTWILQDTPGEEKLRVARRDRISGSWDQAAFIPTPQDGLGRMAPCVQTGRLGKAYCVWEIAEILVPSPPRELHLGFSALPVGGNWAPETVIQAINGAGWSNPGGIGNNKTMMSNSFPSMAIDRGGATDVVYVVWANRGVPTTENTPEATLTDIYMIKSTNAGATWSQPARVSETASDSRDQWHPWVAFDDATGALAVVYLDGGTTPGNNTAAHVAVSYDGGTNWREVKVGDVNWSGNYSLLNHTAYDYIGVAAGGGVAYPTWSDDRSGSGAFRAYVSPLLLGGIDASSIGTVVTQECNDAGNPRVRVIASWATLVEMNGLDKLIVTDASSVEHAAVPQTSVASTHELAIDSLPCVTGSWTYTIESNKDAAVSRASQIPLAIIANVNPQISQGCQGTQSRTTFSVQWTTGAATNGQDTVTLRTPGNGVTYTVSATGGGTSHQVNLTVPCQIGTWTFDIQSGSGAVRATATGFSKAIVSCVSCPPPCPPPCELE